MLPVVGGDPVTEQFTQLQPRIDDASPEHPRVRDDARDGPPTTAIRATTPPTAAIPTTTIPRVASPPPGAPPAEPRRPAPPPNPPTPAATPAATPAGSRAATRPTPSSLPPGLIEALGGVAPKGTGGVAPEGTDGVAPEGVAGVTAATGDTDAEEPVDLATPDDGHARRRRIDESLTRLSAAHRGPVPPREHDGTYDDEPPEPLPAGGPWSPDIDTGARRLRWAAVAAALAVFVAMTVGWSSKLGLDGRIQQVAALDPESAAVLDAEAQAGTHNVLLLGVDTTTGTDPGSDTIVLAHTPADGGVVTRLSFPRNLEINRPPCRGWDPATGGYLDQTVPAETRTTIDTAYRSGGPACVVRVVQQLTGLSVSAFAAVELGGLGDMAGTLGGLPVCLDRPVVDGVLGTVTSGAGEVTLDAATAAGVVRARHVQGDAGTDEGLVDRQQRVLASALDGALSTPALLNPFGSTAFGQVLGRSVVADGMDVDQLLAAASTVRGTGPQAPFVTVPTTGEINTRGNAVLRDRDASALFTALRTGAPLPEVTPSTVDVPAPSAISVDVLNASQRTGLAQDVASRLRAVTFGIGSVANASRPAADTVIRFSPDRSAEAQVVASAVPSARSVPDATASGVLQLVLGDSFDGTIRAVSTTPAGAPAAAGPVADTCS
ncbi:LCP family protein [Pseudonocardia sulfidoxydans]|uniref:LCP family protein n=1 Tax=Pseudonocardia sulfidoxydans TaxID=54011 RepID=UPI0016499E73|nr:LCP family protein [Pseudonocardia sulfidoxydans]